jgi:hypothetical protein
MVFRTLLERYYFERYVLDVAIMTLAKGGTASNVATYQFLPPTDDWGFPKYPHRTAILPPDVDLAAEIKSFILANETYLQEPDCWLGTWINPHTQHYYLDITTCRKNLAEARQAAIEASYRTGRKIVALYNSKRNQTVFLWDDVQA